MTAQEKTEFVILQEDVKHIKEDVKETNEIVVNLNTTMIKLTSKLFKDDKTGEEGYFELTKRNGVRLTKAENKIAIGLGLVMGLGGLLGWWAKTVMK